MIRVKHVLSALFGVSTAFSVINAAFGAPQITWEVENRFRFYEKPEAFKAYLKVAQETRAAGTNDWVLHTERTLQQKYSNETGSEIDRWNGWASKWLNETCWDRQRFLLTNDGRCEDYVVPVSHRVLLSVNGLEDGRTKCSVKIKVIGTPTSSLFIRRTEEIAAQQSNVSCQNIPIEVPFSVNGDSGVEAKVALSPAAAQELAPITIFVKDVMILGMGDSFADGVGNPDLPSQMDRTVGVFYDNFITHGAGQKRLPVRRGGYDGGGTSQISDAQAQWLDIRCFRSQYGPQFRTALHLAADLRQSAVTFLDLACDGARIIEGLLHRKKLDAGYASSTTSPEAQLGLASRLMCANSKSSRPISYKLRFVKTVSECISQKSNEICEFSSRSYQRENIDQTSMRVCGETGADAYRRKIDILLLSIGGNDIGFAPMVGNVLMGDKGISRDILRYLGRDFGAIHDGGVGRQRLELLYGKYKVLDDAIDKFLPLHQGSSKPIFLTAYPLPADDESGKVCGSSTGNASAARKALDVSSAFAGFEDPPSGSLNRLKDVIETSCLLNIRRLGWFKGDSDSSSALQKLTEAGTACTGLQGAAQTSMAKIDWQFEFTMFEKWQGHGFCSVRDGDDVYSSLAIPTFSTSQGSPIWSPIFDQMRPYDSRQRWVRTPNDAFVITNWHTYSQRLGDFANLLAASTTSAMHPTAEGYASMADALRTRVAKFICSERASEFGAEPLCVSP